ncbi:MAG: SHOCT domain-containing protein, partial [Kineosporiaceae bacterium]
MMWQDGYQNAWVWPVIVLVVAAGAGFVVWFLYRGNRPAEAGDGAAEVLRRRFAAGEIDEAEFRERMAVLGTGAQGGRRSGAALPIVVVIAVVLVVTLVVALLAAQTTDGWHVPMMPYGYGGTSSSCDAPSLPGQTVDVTLTDMGGAGMMSGTGNGSGPGMMNGSGPGYRAGMMGVAANP